MTSKVKILKEFSGRTSLPHDAKAEAKLRACTEEILYKVSPASILSIRAFFTREYDDQGQPR